MVRFTQGPVAGFLVALAMAPLSSLAEPAHHAGLVVEGIRCQGNFVTSCSTLRTYLHLSNGDAVDEREVQDAKLRLSSLPNLVSVDLHLAKGSGIGRVFIVIEVVEADRVENEISSGVSSRLASVSQTIEGRLADHNVLGSHDTLNLDVEGIVPLEGQIRRGTYARLQFVDPTLLDTSGYFLISGVTYQNTLIVYRSNAFDKTDQLGIDLGVGRRFLDYSYATVGYLYRPLSKNVTQYLGPSGFAAADTDPNKNRGLSIGYGWDTEDDDYFPTLGSRFSAKVGLHWASVRFRDSWSFSPDSAWTVQLGGTPGTQYRASLTETQNVSVSYQHVISPGSGFGGIKRGRWYVEPGFSYDGSIALRGRVGEWGLKAGVRLDTRIFGVVDLYLIATASEHLP